MPVLARLAVMAAALAASALPHRGAEAQDVPVDLELVLAVDVSGSMDAEERRVQRQGYVEALSHPEVVRAIASGPHGRIALAYVEWAGADAQQVILPWRIIDGPASARDTSAVLAAAPEARIRGTSISGALAFAARLFDGNGFEGLRRVIDVSGDGPNNSGMPLPPVREAVLARGIVINGLPLTLDQGWNWGLAPGELDLYYEDCVIGGVGAFIVPVRRPEDIGEGIRRKLVLEIAGSTGSPVVIPAASPASLRKVAARVNCMAGYSRPSWGEP
ncbi:DUF1194 domain-containing protein [Arenibaculum pallidiluteum]|uniref:DUF1194 domain-containing protein n=1 Tax=Arenibaculum pallidiluteum TaxID=2812559 RepID=UPI001A975318|nr:DUF1194 domain-containing protein [Arenibaculum pallidiluteum]